jgi:hypothetical protein
MYLDGRLPEGYVVLCTNGGDSHSFLVQRVGPSIECPKCGRTALSVDLAAVYYERATADTMAVSLPKEALATAAKPEK